MPKIKNKILPTAVFLDVTLSLAFLFDTYSLIGIRASLYLNGSAVLNGTTSMFLLIPVELPSNFELLSFENVSDGRYDRY